MSVHYDNVGGILKGPLMVSAGDGAFLGADFFHADVFSAPQEPAFRDTIKKCVNNVEDGAVPPAVCRPSLRPETTLDPSGPSGTVTSDSATFAFSTSEPDATFECRVYQAATTPGTFGSCSGNATHSVSGLKPNTYTFEARAVEPYSGQADLSPASRTWTVDPAAAAIAAPSNLTATVGGTVKRPQVSLRWTDNSTNEDNFVVERSEDNGTNWKVLASSLAANTSSYTDKTVVHGGKTYVYRIKATKGAESSAYSNKASATTR
jgi:predicted phage tail protein